MNKRIIAMGAFLALCTIAVLPFAADGVHYASSPVTPVIYNAGWVGGGGAYYHVPAVSYWNWSTSQFVSEPIPPICIKYQWLGCNPITSLQPPHMPIYYYPVPKAHSFPYDCRYFPCPD